MTLIMKIGEKENNFFGYSQYNVYLCSVVGGAAGSNGFNFKFLFTK